MHADGRSLDGTIVEMLVKLLVIALYTVLVQYRAQILGGMQFSRTHAYM